MSKIALSYKIKVLTLQKYILGGISNNKNFKLNFYNLITKLSLKHLNYFY